MQFPKIAGVAAVREGTQITTGIARGSFIAVVAPKPKTQGSAELQYQIALIFPADDPTVGLMKAAMKEAVAKKWPNKVPAGLRNPIRDCAEKEYEGFEKGYVFVTCRSNDKPGVIDAAMKAITDASEIYSGCFVRARINAFGYDKGGNVGVAFGLSHVQKLAEGPSLTGRKSATDVFSPVVVEGDPFNGATEAPAEDNLFD